MKTIFNTLAAIFVSVSLLSAQTGGGAVPVQMVVTAEPFPGSEVPPIGQEDVSAFQDQASLPITEWLPLQNDAAGLELYVLIDEKVNAGGAARLDELRRFISSQAATTAVGIAYMNNGEADIIQTPTRDHALAAKVLRPPSGNMSALANPFTSLSALIEGWSAGAQRREVLLVTDGVDVFEDVGGASMYLDIAIADAQRAAVQVFCFYAPSPGHASHSPALIRGGEDYLADLAEETGGEAYFNVRDGEPSPSFEPYLADVAKHLAHQYRITFLATPVTGQTLSVGRQGFQRVAFRTRLQNVDVVSAHGFYLTPEGARP